MKDVVLDTPAAATTDILRGNIEGNVGGKESTPTVNTNSSHHFNVVFLSIVNSRILFLFQEVLKEMVFVVLWPFSFPKLRNMSQVSRRGFVWMWTWLP
jgi:hypothetical protein